MITVTTCNIYFWRNNLVNERFERFVNLDLNMNPHHDSLRHATVLTAVYTDKIKFNNFTQKFKNVFNFSEATW